MKDSDFDGLTQSLEEARAFAGGEAGEGLRVHAARTIDIGGVRMRAVAGAQVLAKERKMTPRAMERLVVAALALPAAAVAFSDRFGPDASRFALAFAGAMTGLLIRSFLPEPEKEDAISYGTRLAVWLIAILAVIMALGLLGPLFTGP